MLRASADFASVDTIVELEMQGPQSRNPIQYYGRAVRAGDRIAYVRMDQPEVRWLDLDGNLTQIVRWKAPVQQADEEVWAEYEGWFRERLRSQDQAFVDQIVGEARRDFGGQLPHFQMAYGDEAGNVWLSTYSISAFPASKYVILAADGNSAYSVEFPEELRILALTADRVLAVAEDDLDVQTVVVYRLEKPAEG